MNNKSQAGKGDKPRPLNKETFNKNFDNIEWRQNIVKPKEVKTVKTKTVYKY
jgi:hypothetical protein